MRIYLAARWSVRYELRLVRDQMEQMGHQITSQWIDRDDRPAFDGDDWEAWARQWSQQDIEDIEAAEILLLDCRSNGRHGGMHVEFGYALAAGLAVWLIGPKGNVFHHLPVVHHFTDFGSTLSALRLERVTS